MDPVLSEVLEPGKEDSGDECAEAEEIVSKDALRIALKAIKPALVKMPRNKRMKAAADIAARMLKPAARKSADSRRPAMTAPRKKYRADSADLGKRIMNKRNPNYRNR